MTLPPLGTHKDELDTPALCIDVDAFEANVAEAVGLCRQQGIAWRPHAKCHKSPDVAHRLVEAGALGMTCAKLGEAEVFAAAGVTDLLIANLLAGPRKVQRLVEVRRKADPIVTLDHIDQALPINRAMVEAGLRVRAILEIDIGLNRAGVQPGKPALELAKQVAKLPGIELVGIMGYEGHLLTIADPAQKAQQIQDAIAILKKTHDEFLAAGLKCDIVSCGGTGAFLISVRQPGITELQAGGAIFMDTFYREMCQLDRFRYALTVVATVVSRPAPERAIIDAGRKSMNIEIAKPIVKDRPDIRVERLSAEHGQLALERSAEGLKIGDRLEIVPGYGDLTTVLHDHFYVLKEDRLVDIWPLRGRGRLA